MITPSTKEHMFSRQWHVIDATDLILGRLATKTASILRGKHKPVYAPNVDTGDFVVVVNCEKIKLTGKKETDKLYWRYTGYVGGIKSTSVAKMRETFPDRIIMSAVKGMLPKGPLGRKMLKKLKVYAGSEHPHSAQNPVTMTLDN